MKNSVYILGPNGSYSHQAAKVADLRDALGIEQIIFTESNYSSLCCLASSSNERDFAVVPVENTSAGLVEDTRRFYLEILANRAHNGGVLESRVTIVGEVMLPIRHCLVVSDRCLSSKITHVHSHPQALTQCRKLLIELGAEEVPCQSTAGAAHKIASNPQNGHAALCSGFAAEQYGCLKVVREGVQDHLGNETRFHILGKHSRQSTSTNFRTALMVSLRDQPRALSNVLWAIGASDVNVSSLHSIPMGERGIYSFYLEIDCHIESMCGTEILARLDTIVGNMVVLGTYPRDLAAVIEEGGEK